MKVYSVNMRNHTSKPRESIVNSEILSSSLTSISDYTTTQKYLLLLKVKIDKIESKSTYKVAS